MSEREPELKKALAESDAMKPEQARQLAIQTASEFDRRLKWTERRGWIVMIVLMMVFVVALNAFMAASNTKAILGATIAMLLAYGLAIFIQIFAHLTVTMLSVLKETKLLRIERLGGVAVDTALPEERARSFVPRRHALSHREMAAWILGLAVAATVVALVTTLTSNRFNANLFATPTIETYVNLASDGSGTEVMKVSYQYSGWTPCSSFRYTTTDLDARIRWVDAQGRELPTSVITAEGQRHYTVHLLELVMPNVGQEVRYTQITESPHLAQEKQGLWTYQVTRAFGYGQAEESWPAVDLVEGPYLRDIREPKAKISVTMQLPHGSEVVHYDPDQGWRAIWDGTPARGFHATCERNQPLTGTLQYRLETKP